MVSLTKSPQLLITKMKSYFNPIYNMKIMCIFLSVMAIKLHAVRCAKPYFNDVIKFYPSDYFIKLFFDDVRQTSKLHKVRIPFTIQRYPQNLLGTLNLTLYEKFFPINGLIASRTRNIMNIVQLNFKNYIRVGKPSYFQNEIDIFDFVYGGKYRGTDAHILLGNEKLFRMCSRATSTFSKILGTYWTKNNLFAFKFKTEMLLWRICGIRYVPLRDGSVELACVWSSTITQNALDIRVITERIWRISFANEEEEEESSEKEVRESYFQSHVDAILVNEIFRKSNESMIPRLSLEFTAAGGIFRQSKSEIHESSDYLMIIEQFETKFLSCYATPVLRFEMYVRPFELPLWISIGTILSSISIFIYVYNRKKNLSPSFSPFFFFVSTLFEEPYSVPTVLWNDTKFKILTIVWLLTAVIFTNLYAGDMIGDLSVPIREQALYSFQDVFGVRGNVEITEMPPVENVLFWRKNYTSSKVDNLNAEYDTIPHLRGLSSLDYNDYDAYLQKFRKPDHFALLQAPMSNNEGTFWRGVPRSETLAMPFMYNVFDRYICLLSCSGNASICCLLYD
jgi:hypothetical protein